MPKAGETPEMGSNPLLGFGRVYARPQVARFLDRRVHRLVNDPGYEWPDFWLDLQTAGITVWGAAVDTLENTSRFAKGSATGPMTVLHLFNQPLKVARMVHINPDHHKATCQGHYRYQSTQRRQLLRYLAAADNNAQTDY